MEHSATKHDSSRRRAQPPLRTCIRDAKALSLGIALGIEQTIKQLGGSASFVFLPGRTHENLYENGTAEQIWEEMWNTARPSKK